MKNIWGKLLLILIPVIAALVILYPTYRASQLEQTKQEYLAGAKTQKDTLDAMEKFNAKYGEAYESAKGNQLKLGLDLRGGMYVTLEVDVIKLIEESAERETIDDIFEEVLAATKKDAENNDDPVLDIFLANFNDIARPAGKSLISYFDIGDNRDFSEDAIVEKLNENVDQAIDQAQEVIRQRIDQYGVSEPNIQKQGARRIVLELPGVTNESDMRQLLQTTARLEFNLVRNNKEIVEAFQKIDKVVANRIAKEGGKEVNAEVTEEMPEPETGDQAVLTETDTTSETVNQTTEEIAPTSDTSLAAADGTTADTALADTAQKSEEQMRDEYIASHPFTLLFQTFYVPEQQGAQWQQVSYDIKDFPEGEYSFRISGENVARFKEILSRPEVRPYIPANLKVALEAKPDQRILRESDVEIFEFYALKRQPELTGDVITNAVATFDPATNNPVVSMTMNTDGAERWARITGANIKKRIAIVLDNRIYSAPVVQSRIAGGSSQISGMADADESRLLEIVLKAGALKAPVQIVEERVVGPSLGSDSIRSGVTASIIAFVLVILYMIFYYNKGGFVADFAVLLNVLLILSALAALKGTLTLPGIAGIILTIGMAVDANVLIFERIREELEKGRTLKSAIDEGFGKALSAIVDSNITTGITATVLLILGTGPIQGFATTLLIGILATMFTAIVITRKIIDIFVIRGATEFSFGQPKSTTES